MSLDGIDISNNNGYMDLDDVPFDFAICKATEGTGFVDGYCDGYMQQILGSGRLAGVYHFARTGDATEQADFFVGAIRGYVGKALLALDWENAGNYDTTVLSQGPGWALEWLDRVTELTGVRPVIYMSKSVCRQYDWSEVAEKYALWCAQYPDYTPTGYQDDPWTDSYGWGAWDGPTIYQYTSSGDLPGYGGRLDLNVFYGDEAAWRRFSNEGEAIVIPEQVPGNPVNDAGLAYRAHCQNAGWFPAVRDGQTAGSTGYGMRWEALKMRPPKGWLIEVSLHIQDVGWRVWTVDGDAPSSGEGTSDGDPIMGTVGKGLRIEAIGMRVLKRPAGDNRKLQFRVHQQDVGWKAWTPEGFFSGCDAQSMRLEAIQIKIG